MTKSSKKLEVENVNHPGQTSNVDATKYHAMRKVFLEVLPKSEPGLSQREIQEAVKHRLPDDLFPGGKTSGWWAKTVQLDLEAKGVVVREDTKTLRWHRR